MTKHDSPTLTPAGAAQIELAPTDWLWATWRDWQPLEHPATPTFDQADALGRLARLPKDNYRWGWNWDRAHIPTVPSPEEAHFWLVAMRLSYEGQMTPEQIAESLAGMQFDGKLSCERAFALTFITSRYIHAISVALIAALCPPAEIIASIAHQFANSSGVAHSYNLPTALPEALRHYVLPNLDSAQRAQWSQPLAAHLDPAQWPADYSKVAPPAFYLAAMFGGHDAMLRALVESWP